MFSIGKQKQKGTRQQSKLSHVLIGIGGLPLEVDEVVDATQQYSWKARPVREIRLGQRADVFREIVNNRPPIEIGDEIYSYAGGSGFDSRGYFVLVEKVGQKASTAAQPAMAAPAASQTATAAMAAPKGPTPGAPPGPEPAREPARPTPSPDEMRRPGAPVSYDAESTSETGAAKLARYSQLTLEEYEAMPISEAAKVPPYIVERLHQTGKAAAPAPQPEAQAEADLQQTLSRLFEGEQETKAKAVTEDVARYAQLTLEEYEAMPMSEAAEVPPQVVDRLHRRQDKEP